MAIYRFYVRGHGGGGSKQPLPSGNLPIDLITFGEYGCRMEATVADTIIQKRWNTDVINKVINEDRLIYWTLDQRKDWHTNQVLQYVAPTLVRHMYSSLDLRLVLQGSEDIAGPCGVCYWNEPTGELKWILELADKQEVELSNILIALREYVSEGDENQIELYWTACLDVEHRRGNDKVVSFNPHQSNDNAGCTVR
jgi:hypothetical protein